MIKINFQIMGKAWTMRLMEKKKYTKKHGKSVGATKGWKRQIDLHPDGFDLETINHELAHAFRAEMCVDTMTEPSAGDVEEFYCELIAKRARELLLLGDDLFHQVKIITTPKERRK